MIDNNKDKLDVVKILIKASCLMIILGFNQVLSAQYQSNDTITNIAKIDSTAFKEEKFSNDSISKIYIPSEVFFTHDNKKADSVNVVSEKIIPSGAIQKTEKFHSPHRASMYAAVIPGLGQIYNKKYWKIPILFGGIGGVAYAVSFNSERYSYYRGAYRDFIIKDPANKSYLKIIEGTFITEEHIYKEYQQWFRDYLNSSKKRFKRYRDISYASVVAVYLISIIDASIDAHFYYFDISDDLSFSIQPAYIHVNGDFGGTLGLSFKFNF